MNNIILSQNKRKSFINTYLITDIATGLVKIGKSENPIGRLKTLQCGSAGILSLSKVFDADIEILLHNEFSSKKVHGEWFSVSVIDVCNFVKSIDISRYETKSKFKKHIYNYDFVDKMFYMDRDSESIDCGDIPYYESDRYTDIRVKKEYNMILMIIFGNPEENIRMLRNISDYDDILSVMSIEMALAIRDLQRANTVYIEDGIEYQERKDKLTALFNRKHKDLLIEEVHLINA